LDRRDAVNPQYMVDRGSGQGRKNKVDRRTEINGEDLYPLKRNSDGYIEFASTQKGLMLGILLSIPVWALIIQSIWASLIFSYM
jgi:hypothetical protein